MTSDKDNSLVEITDILGRTVYRRTSDGLAVIDTGTWLRGLYVVHCGAARTVVVKE